MTEAKRPLAFFFKANTCNIISSLAGSVSGFTASMTTTPLGDHTTEFTLTFVSAAELPMCLLDYGDDNVESFIVSDASVDTVVTYTHTTNNFYDINVYCMTSDVAVEDAAPDTYVGDFVTGFVVYNAQENIIPVFAPLSSDVDVDLRIDNGTDVTLTATLMQSVQVVETSNVSVGTENILTFSQSYFPINGLYTLNASAVNPITGPMERYVMIAIQEQIIVTSVAFGGTNYVQVETPFDIDLTLSSGEDATLTYDIYDDTNVTVVEHLAFVCDGVVREHKHTYQINVTGTFYVRASVSNMVSSHTEMITVISQNAVSASIFQLSASKSLALAPAFVSFSITSTPSLYDIVPAGLVSCVLEFGNGMDHTMGADLTTAPLMPISDLQNLMLNAGFYIPTLTCSNEIPTEFEIVETMIRIENEVANIQLDYSTDNIPLSVGMDLKVVLINVSDPPLYLITCSFDFGDGNSPIGVTGNVTSNETIDIHYDYTRPWAFTITVYCAGTVPDNNLELTLDVEAYWDCWKSLLFFESFKTTELPMTFFGHEELKVSFFLSVSRGKAMKSNLY